jgi:transcriptional regulator with XRE-family HTH domain
MPPSVNRTSSEKKRLKSLGDKVKDARMAKGLTLSQLAFAIGKEPQSIHRLEAGKINPSYLYLLEVCKGLDVEITTLLVD